MKRGLFVVFLIFLAFFIYNVYDFVSYTINSGWSVTYNSSTASASIIGIFSMLILLIIPLLLLVIYSYLFLRGKSEMGRLAKTAIVISTISIAILVIFKLIPRASWIHLSSQIKYSYLFFTSTNYTHIPYVNYLFYFLILISSIMIIIGYSRGKRITNNSQYSN